MAHLHDISGKLGNCLCSGERQPEDAGKFAGGTVRLVSPCSKRSVAQIRGIRYPFMFSIRLSGLRYGRVFHHRAF